jgi:hypothetical protein
MSAQSVRKVKRPIVVTTLETKLKIIRNVKADLWCYKDVLAEMKKGRIQPTLDSFSRRRMIHSLQLLHLSYFNKIIKLLNICLKFNSKHICMYKICTSIYLITFY